VLDSRTRPAPLAQFGPGAGQKLYLNFMTAKFLAARLSGEAAEHPTEIKAAFSLNSGLEWRSW